MTKNNYDHNVIDDFGNEWEQYDQSSVNSKELERQFSEYFKVFSWNKKITNGVGADFGCGTGRWANFVANKVNFLICIDASTKAVSVAKKNLVDKKNCYVVQGMIDGLPILDDSLDFAYSLGVLHHMPDTERAIKSCVSKLKPGAPLLLYLYYAFDNRPFWYLLIWKCTDIVRKFISKLPFYLKKFLTNFIAIFVYFPLARLSFFLEKIGVNISNIPLSEYRKKSFYTMRTDSLDRFGTRLEQRFTKENIEKMMKNSELENISFSNTAPYWCVVGYKKNEYNLPD